MTVRRATALLCCLAGFYAAVIAGVVMAGKHLLEDIRTGE